MNRHVITVTILLLAVCSLGCAQEANLCKNGGFEAGVEGWALTVGAYGQDLGSQWDKQQAHARLVDAPVHGGKKALLLDATGLETEVDVYSPQVPVKGGFGYDLASYVQQQAGDKGYKVTIDWIGADDKHISYDNDWRGSNKPENLTLHGGIYVAPPDAAKAVLILGVSPGVRCVFDDISLTEVGQAEPLSARPRKDGDGSAQITGPATIPAHGKATWRVTYTCGQSGLPSGGAIKLRRWPLSFEWSDAQSSDPKKPGYVTARGPRDARFAVVPSSMSDIRVRLLWPALQPGDKVEITLGDTSGGSPGMVAQGKAAKLHWIASSDCNADDKFGDLTQVTGTAFEVVPGTPHHVVVVAPATAEVGKPTKLSIEVRDDADNVCTGDGSSVAISASSKVTGLPEKAEFPAGKLARVAADVTFTKAGLCDIGAKIGGGITDGGALVTVSAPSDVALRANDGAAHAYMVGKTAVLANGAISMVFPANPFGYGYAAVYAAGDSTRPQAVLPSFGSVVWPSGAAGQTRALFADKISVSEKGGEAALVFEGAATTPTSKRWPLTVRFSLKPGAQHVQTEFELTPTSPEPVLAFYGPTLCAGDWAFGDKKTGALFPGLEYMTGDEVSSDEKGVAWEYRERWVPHPYKITMPLMAVAGNGATVGLMWDPLQKWDGTHTVPLARFASPNRPEHHSGSLMTLFAPYVPEDFKENQITAAKPWTPPAGSTLRLSADVFALGGTEDVTSAVAYWAKTHALPQAKPPRSWPDEMALCAQGLMTTGWDAKGKGWIPSIGWKPARDPGMADRLTMAAKLSGKPDLSRQAAEIVGQAFPSGPAGLDWSLRSGTLESSIIALRGGLAPVSSQHPEGFWTYAQCYDIADDRATLAEPDDVALGTVVNNLWAVLRYAVATGDPKATEAGLRGLQYIRRFTKPSGAESWEVPLVCPNLRAAALALDCNLAAYKLTGKPEYLDGARYWAWAGLSFIYQWQAPDRPIMQGSSISVMGTTFYRGLWFGNAVQWVGLVYAESLERLAAVDKSYQWLDAARLITVACMQQQKTPDAPCKHLGYFPDSYTPVLGHDTYEWCLSPTGIIGDTMGTLGLPPTADTVVARSGDSTIHLTSVAAISSPIYDAGASRLQASLHYLPGQTACVVIFGLSKPTSVTWQGREIAPVGDLAAAPEGFSFNERYGFVGVKLAFGDADGQLALSGGSPVPFQPPSLSTQVPNGGFEDGTLHWGIEAGGTIDTDRPHSGKAALLISCTEPGKEAQANGEPVQVTAGVKYRLSAWVWEVAGEGNYKVTVDWRDAAGGHISYDNDWQGTNRPAQWTEHGGVFAAPAGAASAVIILGVRGGSCLFDDISLQPEGK